MKKKLLILLLLLCPFIINAKTFNNFSVVQNYTSTYFNNIKNNALYFEKGSSLPFKYVDNVLSVDNRFTYAGLLNLFEFNMSKDINGESYLYNGLDFWTMTDNENSAYVINSTQGTNYSLLNKSTSNSGFRPTVYLKNNVKLSGQGTYTNPWTLTTPTYELIFNVNEGAAFNATTCGTPFTLSGTRCSKEVVYKGSYGTLPTPSREYHSFLGWYTEASGGVLVNSDTKFESTENVTLYAHWKKEYTGVPNKNYTEGQTITYGGTDWLVVKDYTDQVTLISKNNITTSLFGTNSTWASSSVKTYLNGTWLNSKPVILQDVNGGGIVYDSSSESHVRLIRKEEITNKLINGSNTNFWTMTASGSNVWYALANTGLSYISYSTGSNGSCYSGSSENLSTITKTKATYSSTSNSTLALPTATSSKINGTVSPTSANCYSTYTSSANTRWRCSKNTSIAYATQNDATNACAATSGYSCRYSNGGSSSCYSDYNSANNACSGQTTSCLGNNGNYYGNSLYEACVQTCSYGMSNYGMYGSYYSMDGTTCGCRYPLPNQLNRDLFWWSCSGPSVVSCTLSSAGTVTSYTASTTYSASGTGTTYNTYAINNNVTSALGVRPVITVKKSGEFIEDIPVVVEHKVTFNVNGGNAFTSSTCGSGFTLSGTTCSKKYTPNSIYGTLPTPTKSNSVFLGWYTAATGGTQVTANTQATSTTDHTLYAQYSSPVAQVISTGAQSDASIDFASGSQNAGTNGIYYTADTTYGEDGQRIYYYRGNVDNNYVLFAGYYWRIIRTTAEGGVKLIYAGDGTATGGRISMIDYNAYYTNKYYVGYTNGSSYSGRTNSNAKTVVDSWYSSHLNSYASYLSNTAVYCNDKTEAHAISGSMTTFNAWYRVGPTDVRPSFACPSGNYSRYTVTANSTNGNNGFLTYPVALITADEAMYAGVSQMYGSVPSTNTYLHQNMGSSDYQITMTPIVMVTVQQYTYYPNGARIVRISGGYLQDEDVCAADVPGDPYQVATSGGIGYYRPVIALKSCVRVTGGNGKKATPYTITNSGC